MTNDAELLRRYAEEGSEEAFTEFVRASIGLVHGSAARRLGGDGHRAGEVAQQVFIAAARHAGALARHRNLQGWLFAATRNVALNLMRDEQRRMRREHAAAESGLAPARAAEDAAWTEIRPVLDEAIDGLGERDREAVLLRYFSGLPAAEIARKIGVSENTARMRVQRALEKLQARLARRGITSTAAALGLALAQRAVAEVPAGVTAQIAGAALTCGAGAGGGAALAGELLFMTTGKWLAVAAGVAVLVGTGGLSIYSVQAAQRAEREVSGLRSEHARLRETLAAARERAATAEREAEALVAQVEPMRTAAQAAAAASATPATAAARAWDPTAEGTKFMARHPEVKQALADYVAASGRFKYGALYRELGWNEAQVAEFAKLAGFGAGMGASLSDGRSVSLRHEAVGARVPDWSERFNDLLGADGVRRFDELNRQKDGRYLATDIASALYFTDTPLLPAQAAELIEIVTAARVNRPAPGAPPFDWDEVLAKARDLLAPAQFDVLAAQRAKFEFNRILNRPTPAAGAAKEAGK